MMPSKRLHREGVGGGHNGLTSGDEPMLTIRRVK